MRELFCFGNFKSRTLTCIIENACVRRHLRISHQTRKLEVFLGWGICPLLSPPSAGICQLKCPRPQEFAIHKKKKGKFPGVSPGGAWMQLELTDVLVMLIGLSGV